MRPIISAPPIRRLPHPLTREYGDPYNGAALVTLESGEVVRAIFSNGEGWDHVSVSLPDRCPTWGEMCEIKDMFFDAQDCVMQLHPPRSQYINRHPYCLHLWRPHAGGIPMPPLDFV